MVDIRDWTYPEGGGGIGITYWDLKKSAENREHRRALVKRMKILRALDAFVAA